MNIKLKQAIEYFNQEIGKEEVVVRAPSRANIIGEHIDYCGASVLPFATEPSMYFILKKGICRSNHSSLYAYDTNETCDLVLNRDNTEYAWADFILSIVKEINSRYKINDPFQLLFTSEIPIGGGMSSSSALCCGVVYGLNELFDLKMNKDEMLKLASSAEYGLGLEGGIMDQFTILFGKKNQALLLDCLHRSSHFIDLPRDAWRFVLIDSGIKHRLIGSEYNTRRKQVAEALAYVNKSLEKNLKYTELGDEHLVLVQNEKLRNRLRHIISEIQRVKQAVKCIKNINAKDLGTILWKSHDSLKEDYEVSCEEVDFIVDELRKHKAVLGARIMGGGFGGHTIVLLNPEVQKVAFSELKKSYYRRFGLNIKSFEIQPTNGIELLKSF